MRWLAAAALVALSALLIVAAADGALLRQGLGELARNPGLLAVLVGGYAAAFAWRALLGGEPEQPGIGRLVAILHASLLANHALPVKAGEVLRPALAACAGVPLAEATVSTVVARVLDVAALLAIATALLPLTTVGGESPVVLGIPALLLVVAAAGLFWLRAAPAPRTRIDVLDRAWMTMRDALRALPPRAVLRALAFTAPSWLRRSRRRVRRAPRATRSRPPRLRRRAGSAAAGTPSPACGRGTTTPSS